MSELIQKGIGFFLDPLNLTVSQAITFVIFAILGYLLLDKSRRYARKAQKDAAGESVHLEKIWKMGIYSKFGFICLFSIAVGVIFSASDRAKSILTADRIDKTVQESIQKGLLRTMVENNKQPNDILAMLERVLTGDPVYEKERHINLRFDAFTDSDSCIEATQIITREVCNPMDTALEHDVTIKFTSFQNPCEWVMLSSIRISDALTAKSVYEDLLVNRDYTSDKEHAYTTIEIPPTTCYRIETEFRHRFNLVGYYSHTVSRSVQRIDIEVSKPKYLDLGIEFYHPDVDRSDICREGKLSTDGTIHQISIEAVSLKGNGFQLSWQPKFGGT